jgi:hypothetical protein
MREGDQTHVTPMPSLMFLVLLAIAVTLYSTFVVKPGSPFRCASYVGGRDYSAGCRSRPYKKKRRIARCEGTCRRCIYSDKLRQTRGFVLPTAEEQRKVSTHPRTAVIAKRSRQSDAKWETARTGPCIDILAPERERLSTNRRRHRPATRVLVHPEQALDLFDSNLILCFVWAFGLSCIKKKNTQK